MFQKRVVVCLDVRDGKTTKGIKFKGNVDIGDPVLMAEEYYKQGVDELVFYDITASSDKRGIMIDVVKEVAKRIFIPFTVGGGINSLEDIRAVIDAGAEKVSLNSGAVRNPNIIKEGAEVFGNQCIVLAMDAKADDTCPSGYRIVTSGGRNETQWDALEWAKEGVRLGAGEIVLNSIDADGMKTGYEMNLTKMISEAVSVPVVASGGAGVPKHLADVLTEGKADAALIASMVHYGDYTVSSIKNELKELGVSVRIV
ncbi:imidazole glycerol phosphate synthase subunit HisF [Thiospirochaeta perfilievii]|uniref:Imidazole glycerol phosphate synthase subunit HisF n=1 Tax=Thiospirochaeta perfilievii TaxID=252967 RepID=A0A5C1Q886_9SPIO|nr:imidazole glycerol phosphate synthase subunit HisF [Thiospirochaeta perfilievii]QEN03627.1 imidazole glycerol phosphate synthase subunit HisF [Thiospirochaeta perfilievii]